ncbi:hypothetical protein POHY109586_15445 [Polaromonas hydrogenivorans]
MMYAFACAFSERVGDIYVSGFPLTFVKLGVI